MKSGRPSFHIPARWIVISIPGKERVAYKLDNKGNPIKKNGTIQPDPTFDFKRADEQRLSMQFSLPKPKHKKNDQSSSVISQPMTPITSQYQYSINTQIQNSTPGSGVSFTPIIDFHSSVLPPQSKNIPNQTNLQSESNQINYNYIQQNKNQKEEITQHDSNHFGNTDDDDFYDLFSYDFF